MKKVWLSLIVGLLLLVGCNTETASDDKIDISVIISIDNDEERLVDETLSVEEGAILLDVLDEQYDIQKSDEGFIEGIEGQEQYDNHYWFYEVNDEEAYVGAGEYELADQDVVHFDLHEYEG
ncbi:uncharacterized protein DUF4430 [Streptohalobacillus salinus]|uniref:Uncharacterized protein DUF4430 n=1 Tax=Streptohalobacillus salinus TaxID=621096 RepID=A0A2V3WDZ0_9BACI|nr:DUF4430 domain-containing protein [Streptohalobacillus salinus]PXW91706.1 uncharacterized protein DUF4430 [Streptohalobacillus salinus]